MSFFSSVEKVKAAGNYEYIKPGEYEAEVRLAKNDTHPGDGTPYFLVEYKILAAVEGSGNRVGSCPSHMVMIKGNKQQMDKALGEAKACIAAVMQIDPDKVTTKLCDDFVGEHQPGKGKMVRISARNKVTKNGKDFTVISYHNPVLEK